MAQCVQAVVADGVGHRAECADRGEPHDPADQREEHRGELLDTAGDAQAGLAAGVQAEAEQRRDEEHRQDVVAGEGADQRGRDHRQDELDEALMLRRGRWQALGGERRDVDVQSAAGLDDVDDDEADHHGDGGENLEVDQRLEADPADRAQVVHGGDAVYDRAEDDRRDHHSDQCDEPVAQGFELGAEGGPQPAHHGVEAADADQALDVEVESSRRRRLGGAVTVPGAASLRLMRGVLPGRERGVRLGRYAGRRGAAAPWGTRRPVRGRLGR